ncbi:MAG: SRPBCC domain-containing protein [Bacteroidota bacterium]
MTHLQTEIILNAPNEKVWNTLVDFQAYKSWNPFIISSSGKAVVGEKLTNTMLHKGKPTTFTPVITKVEIHKELEWLGSGSMGAFKGRHYFKLEDLGNGQTKLIHGEHFSGILRGIVMRMIGEDTLKSFQKMNKALKEVVEG